MQRSVKGSSKTFAQQFFFQSFFLNYSEVVTVIFCLQTWIPCLFACFLASLLLCVLYVFLFGSLTCPIFEACLVPNVSKKALAGRGDFTSACGGPLLPLLATGLRPQPKQRCPALRTGISCLLVVHSGVFSQGHRSGHL